MSVYEELKVGRLDVDEVVGAGMPPYARNKIFLDPTYGSDGNDGLSFTTAVKTLDTALGKIVTGRQDRIYYISGSSGINLTSTILWTYHYSQFSGITSGLGQGSRARFFPVGTVSAVSPMITVSGSGNYFSDLYFSHDKAHADNHNVCTVSGAYNRFDRCNFAGPLDGATQGADTAYKTLIVSAGYNLFNHCIIGLDTAAMSVANCLLSLAGTNHAMNTFEDCIFLMQANASAPFFIVDSPTSGQGTGSLFKRCSFINVRGQAQTITYAVSWAEAGGGLAHIFDQCTFFGVADIIATGNVSRTQFSQYGETAITLGLNLVPAV